jgi:hypothetical protein
MQAVLLDLQSSVFSLTAFSLTNHSPVTHHAEGGSGIVCPGPPPFLVAEIRPASSGQKWRGERREPCLANKMNLKDTKDVGREKSEVSFVTSDL